MTNEDKILEIELEKLELEKRRDKASSNRFIIGSILTGVATLGVSIFLNFSSEARAKESAERNLIIPILFSDRARERSVKRKLVNDFLEIENLSKKSKYYLQGIIKKLDVKDKADLDFELAQKEAKQDTESAKRALEVAKTEADEQAKLDARKILKLAQERSNKLKQERAKWMRDQPKNEWGVLY